MRTGPRSLKKSLQATAESYDHAHKLSIQDLFGYFSEQGPNNALRVMFGAMIARWDYVSGDAWINDTKGSTLERRALI